MSGGVDSSVAALMLVEQGHDVFGLTMRLWPRGAEDGGPTVCCGPEPAVAAGRVASDLAFPHHVVSMAGSFEDSVVAPFVSEYARGRTPNPCVRCNALIKFGELLDLARGLGADVLATGHHAIARKDPSGRPVLARSPDAVKDQSYFLHRLTREQLERVVFPVGGLSKDDVRGLARERGLHVADRVESQDVCFVPRGGLGGFLRERVPDAMRPGLIVDLRGNVLGEHSGIAMYTVGQRGGLGLSRPSRSYVVAIDAVRNAVIVGDDLDLFSDSLTAADPHWISGEAPARVFGSAAKVRSTAEAAPCEVEVKADSVSVRFEERQRALTPGQAVVFYDGDVVLGGAVIERAGPPA